LLPTCQRAKRADGAVSGGNRAGGGWDGCGRSPGCGRMWRPAWRMWPECGCGPKRPECGDECGHPLSRDECGHPLSGGCGSGGADPNVERMWRMWRRMWTPTSPPIFPGAIRRTRGPGTPTFHPPTFHPLFMFTHDPRQAADDERRTWKGFGGFGGIWTPTFRAPF
jgi:hypothetical protein